MEAPHGIEPWMRVLQTRALPLGYGAIILFLSRLNPFYKKNGAEDEIRTRDIHLGKVTLYH